MTRYESRPISLWPRQCQSPSNAVSRTSRSYACFAALGGVSALWTPYPGIRFCKVTIYDVTTTMASSCLAWAMPTEAYGFRVLAVLCVKCL